MSLMRPPRPVLLLLSLLLALQAGCSASPARQCSASSSCPGGRCVDGRCVADTDASGGADAGTDAGVSVADTGSPDTSGCLPGPETVCNRVDDDCNGQVDDVDVGGDGICDCLSVGVFGNPGALASSSFQAWLTARGTTVERVSLDATPLTADLLARYDVILLDWLVRDYSAAEAALLEAFVTAGGGVLAMTGYDGSGVDFQRPNTLLAPFGAAYVAGLHNGPVTMWEPHPISTGLSSVTFAGGYLIMDAAGTGTVVARLDGGTAGLAIEHGAGRVFVWGDEWIEFDSEWSTMPMITALWTNLFAWLGPRDRCILVF